MPNELYTKLKQDGLYTKSEVEFMNKYGSPEGQQDLYNKLYSDSLYTKDFKSFQDKYFIPTQPTVTPTGNTVNGVPTVTIENDPYAGIKNAFQNIKNTLGELQNYSTPQNVENSFKVQMLGITLPRLQQTASSPEELSTDIYKPLFKANTKELSVNESELNDDSPASIYKQNLVQNKFLGDLQNLQEATSDEISAFIKDKKEKLKIAEQNQRKVLPIQEPTPVGITPPKSKEEVYNANLEQEYRQLSSDLDGLAKAVSFENSSWLYKDIDSFLKQNDETSIQQLQQVGNDIQNVGNDVSRATFKARANMDLGTVKYDKLYKDKLAYLGIQSEINGAQKDIQADYSVLSEKLAEIEDLTNQLQANPSDKELNNLILQKASELEPLKQSIDKKRLFINKLSQLSLTLPELDKEYSEQGKADILDKELSEQWGSQVGRPIGIAVQGLSNKLSSTLKGAALLGNEISSLLGRNKEEVEINRQNLQLDKSLQFSLPSRIKYAKPVEIDFNSETPVKINWEAVVPLALQTTGEMLLMGAVGAPLARLGIVGEFAGLYAGAATVYGGELFQQELEKGLSFNEALAITGLRIGAEAVTEKINPVEFIPFNGALKPLSKTISKADFVRYVGSNWKSLFPKLKAKGINIASFLKNASKAMVLEPVEEVMSDLFNYGIDEFTINNIKPDYRRDNEFTLSNELETALSTALTMAPVAIYQGYAETKAQNFAPALRLKAAQQPKLFLTSLEDNFKKGHISEDFYKVGKEEVETVSNLYNTNKAKIDIAPEEDKIPYLDALYQHDKVSKELLSETDVEKKEKLIPVVEKTLREVQKYDTEYSPLVNNSKAQFAKKEEIYIQNIKDFSTKQDLEKASIEDLQQSIPILQDVINNPFSENVKNEAEKQLFKIEEQLQLKQEKLKEEQTSVKTQIEIESEKINNLSKEELQAYKIPKEIQGEERKQLVQAKIKRESQLEDEENTLTFQGKEQEQSIPKGQWVKIEGQPAIYKAKDFQNGKFIATFSDGSQDISINPKENLITPLSKEEAQKLLSPQEAQEEQIESKEQLESIFGKQIEDAEDSQGKNLVVNLKNNVTSVWNSKNKIWEFYNKNGEQITNTRQLIKKSKELANIPNSINVWWDSLLSDSDKAEVIDYLQSLKSILLQGVEKYGDEVLNSDIIVANSIRGVKFTPSQIEGYVTDLNKKVWTSPQGQKLDLYVIEVIQPELLENGFNLEEDEIINQVYDLINSYPKGITKKDIAKLIDENNPSKKLIDLEEEFTIRFGIDLETVLTKIDPDKINAYEVQEQSKSQELPATIEEIQAQQELERLQEEEAKEKQEKEQLSVEKKEIEDKIKYATYNPLGTVAPFETDANAGIVEKTSANSLKYLQNQLNTTGKSLSDLGYYITVHSVVDFPKEKYFKEWQNYWEKNNTPDDKRGGLVAVITDKEGNIKLFNEAGEPSEDGIWSIHQVRKNFKQPENLSPERLAEWKSDVQKAEKLQKAVKPNNPIVIQSTIKAATPTLTKGTIANNYKKGEYTFSIGANSEIKTKEGAYKIYTGKKIGDIPNIAEAIYDFLNINNSEGLPESYISKSKDDVKTAFWNRLSFREYNPELKTFPEIFAYTRQSLIFQVNEDGTPYITDKNKPNSFKIEGRDNFINFLKKEQLNLHKRAEYNTPLDVYYFNNNKFEKQTIDYKDFVANNFTTQVAAPVGNPHFVFETAVKKVQPEIKDTPVKEEPLLEQPQNPTKKKFDFSNIKKEENTIDDITETKGLDRVSTLSQKTTTKQEEEAKTWFDEYLSKSGANFQDSRNIANSTAFATWTQSAITLWKSGKYTDLYHEAWHDFTQMFLTKEQKKAIYEEAEKSEAGQKAIKDLAKKLGKNPFDLSEIQKFYALEELLAEDFYNYQLSNQKLILNNRVKRNTIFRKIYNFLKYILTGKPDLQRLYRQLANNQINKAKRDPSNALFGKLNKSIEGLSIQDSLSLYKALDGIIAQQLNNRGITISRIFLESDYLNKVYGTVKNSLLQSAEILAEQYESNPTSELEYTLNNLQYTLQNWNTVKEAHKNNSNYLKVSKELIPYEEYTEDGDEIETNEEKYGDQRDNQNPMDNVSQFIIYLVASLPEFEYKNGKPVEVFNKFLPNVQETVDFNTAWKQLAKNLQGDKDYSSMYSKVEKLAKQQPSFKPLLTALPNPSKELNRYELQLVASFINAFSKPVVPLKVTSFEYKEDGRVNIQSRNGESTTVRQLQQDWNLALQELPNEYAEQTETSQRALNLPKIVDDFKYLSSKNSRDFLDALGFTFSQGTKESPELLELLEGKNKKLTILRDKLKEYRDLQEGKYRNITPSQAQITQIKRPVFSPVEILSKSIWVDGKALFEAPKEIIDELINIELTYSEQYHSDVATGAEDNPHWLHKDWSLQSQDYSLLNDEAKFPTYQDLIQDPIGQYFNIDINPDADNIFLQSLFILNVPKTNPNYGKRRSIKGGKTAQLNLFDQNGIKISVDNEREGIKTSKLPRFLALIQDIPTFLSTGEKQHPRYGDKSTSRGTLTKYPPFVPNISKNNPNLPVDLTESKFPNKVSDQAWFIFRNSLISTLQITNNQTSRKLYDNTANLPKNIQYIPFGKFDKVLSKETKELLKAATSEEIINIPSLIDTYQEAIKQDIANYFISQRDAVLDELKENTTITQKDYIPDYLLRNYSLEQLIHSFALNTWIINSEHERLVFQDSRYYDMKVDKDSKRNLREPFKRYSKASSTGTIAANNQQINSFFNSPESNSFAEKAHYDAINKDNPSLPYTEQGIVNSVIVNDIEDIATDVITDLLKYLKNSPDIEQEAVREKYDGFTLSDAMAFCVLDFYRNLKLRIGEEGWSDESEKLYQKIARGEKLTKEDENNSFLFFSPIKFRVAGRTFDKERGIFVPIDYKFAITPLLPTMIKGKTLEIIKNNMIRQNAHLLPFKSASKHSAITNNGKYNNLYNEDGTPFTGDYTFNQVPIEYFYEVVNAPESYKEESRYSTQLRTLLFVNLFDNGKPQDFRKSKEDWDKLSESDKKKASPSYKRATEFRDNIDKIVKVRKEKLLKEIGATLKPDNTYSVDDAKFSKVLEREFERKNLPFNVLKSIQVTENGTFKFPFDATIARDEIENTILSIIDNQLRKQNVYGESLIQVSSAGFETTQDDKLPFYKDLGRTTKEGEKVTSAHKVKIALQGDFKKLLQHPDVLDLSAKNSITPLEALNQLIQDEKWLDKGDNRQLITITGVRIPVQGLNSQEFMEVYEFLPTESGNIIVVSPALVAKSGGDFDWDKITSYFPHIYINNNGEVLPVKKLSNPEIEELYNSLSKELKAYLKEFQQVKEKELSPKEIQTFLSSNKLISDIFGEDLTTLVYDSFSQDTIPSKNQFINLYKERVAHNENITIMREVLENPNNYVNLLLPNATYMFEDIADEIRNAEQKTKPSLSDNYTVTESLNQHESNFVGKDALGIGAIYNKFLPILQQAGAYLNPYYTSNIEFGTQRNTRNRFPHNSIKITLKKWLQDKLDSKTLEKEDLSIGENVTRDFISLSGVWSVDKPGRGKYKISEAISQLMNGWVDVAKKDWIFYINGTKQFAPTMLFHLMQGTHKDDVIAFFNQPVLNDYINTLSNLRNPLIKSTDREKYNNAKKEAIYQTLLKYLPEDVEVTVTKFKKPVKVNAKQELTEKYNGKPVFFYSFVATALRDLADNNSHFFNSEKFDFYKFAIPTDNKIAIPTTDKEKLAQALYLIQYLELEEQTKLFNQMRRTMNNDTSKASSFQYSATRAFEQEVTKLHDLFPSNIVDKMINESSIAAFTNQTTGIDKFISQVTPELFEITNHPEFNKFLNSEWNKPEDENFIAFQDKDSDTKESWIKTFKNDFILYLYDNNVFDENDNLVSAKVYQQMQYNTALGNEIEAIKRDFPDLAKNNLFLDYLVKDNSLKPNSQGKPEKVNIKLKYDKLDKDNSDIMSQDFEKLLNFQDPNYTIDQQNRIKTFAANLQDFAYVQSGLNKTPYYLAKYIPQDNFAGKIQPAIEKIAEIFNNNPTEAKEILKQFNAKFRFNNPKFYTQKFNDEGEPIVPFNTHEPFRYKAYINPDFDLFGKKAKQLSEKLQKKTKVQATFKANEAKENPTSLFIFGDSKDQKATQNSALITLSKEGNSFKRTPQDNVIGIPVFNTRDSYFKDTEFSENQALIDNAIKQILDKEQEFSNIIFSDNLFETSKLSEKAPATANYVVSKLNDIFGTNYQPVEEVKFEVIEEEILPKTEENTKEKRGCEDPI